jgi:hypothetical protein
VILLLTALTANVLFTSRNAVKAMWQWRNTQESQNHVGRSWIF